ncbi:anhydro-N-acetylmuramic acid kinase [Asaia krungthepensis]|uniref:Anhydro-N-acetylmuramic acid kinase n=1 Tax=Asaia krungthepensis NRIC 0535 TaxID=1307925 RepID=A0ABQ0Q6Z4_9PROT|nr:anhydro-N-acetylmuramic acid kinase [Asaia krungthepensis]GBQ94017.1 anhydro-N-acetylmuramic acid kinase [Asaia krungthepensis NRIC 0535]
MSGFVYRTIGMMSGTSLDGVDAALIETDGVEVLRRGASLSLPYPASLRRDVYALFDRAATLRGDEPDLLAAEQELTALHVEAVRQILTREGEADLIGFHGQTLYHAPDRGRTWQIGDASLLSRETGLPVIHDFRRDDVAHGGEGAPLAPWYHAACLAGEAGPVAILNIGGVANITFVGRDGAILAGDTGPGNALLDDWAFRHTGIACDRDGALARAGKLDERVLSVLLDHPFFSRLPPKSLDRQEFAGSLDRISLLSPEDGAATLVAFTVKAIAQTQLPEPPRAWFVCGGGRHNPALMTALAHAVPGAVKPVEALGWDGDMVEAECFAFLAVRSLRGLPLSAPGITGATGLFTGGRLSCAGIRPELLVRGALARATGQEAGALARD